MSSEGVKLLSGRKVPKLERVVVATRQCAGLAWRERNRIDRFGVPFEGTELFSDRDVPEPNVTTVAATPGQGALPVQRKRDRIDWLSVPGEMADLFARCDVPSLRVPSTLADSARPSNDNATELTAWV